MKELNIKIPIPLRIRAYDTRATPNYPSLPALAHEAAIPAEGVRFTIKNNIYIIHQLELKQQQS